MLGRHLVEASSRPTKKTRAKIRGAKSRRPKEMKGGAKRKREGKVNAGVELGPESLKTQSCRVVLAEYAQSSPIAFTHAHSRGPLMQHSRAPLMKFTPRFFTSERYFLSGFRKGISVEHASTVSRCFCRHVKSPTLNFLDS